MHQQGFLGMVTCRTAIPAKLQVVGLSLLPCWLSCGSCADLGSRQVKGAPHLGMCLQPREKVGNKGWSQICSSITCQQLAVPSRGPCVFFHPVPAPCVPMKSMSCAGPGAGLGDPCVSLPMQDFHNSLFPFQLMLEGPFRSTN